MVVTLNDGGESYSVPPEGFTGRAAGASIGDNDINVGVTAIDSQASEDGRDQATFRIERTPTGPTGDLTVYYTFSGTATHGTVDADGNPTPSDADFVGGTPVPGSTSTFKVVIPAGQTSADVTVTPLNDSLLSEGTESIKIELSEDLSPDGPFYFLDGGNQPKNAQADQTNLSLTVDDIPVGGHSPTQAERDEVAALMPNLDSQDDNVWKPAKSSLTDKLKANPQLEQTYLSERDFLLAQGQTRLDEILAEAIPPTFTIDANGVLTVHRKYTTPFLGADYARLFVFPELNPPIVGQTPGQIWADLDATFVDGTNGRALEPLNTGDSVIFVTLQYRMHAPPPDPNDPDADPNPPDIIVREDTFNLFVHAFVA